MKTRVRVYAFLIALLLPLAIIAQDPMRLTGANPVPPIPAPECKDRRGKGTVNTCQQWTPVTVVTFHPTPSPFKSELGHVEGITYWYIADGISYCDIFAEIPSSDSDPDMSTLGHEFLHCVLGNHHPAHP